AGCPILVWTGGAPAAARVLSAAPGPLSVIGSSRIKTDGGLGLADTGTEVLTVCACADVSLSLDPALQAFVHDVQAESGAPPGPSAVEAYDAGRLLIGQLEGTDGSRGAVASALADLDQFMGLGGAYAFEPDGSRQPLRGGIWRAAGSRWLLGPTLSGASASPG
ncbi:MAG: hypothetical protein ACRDHM_10805, partial [Actinomycetota bacterium]